MLILEAIWYVMSFASLVTELCVAFFLGWFILSVFVAFVKQILGGVKCC
jgi:hypothetical protein